MALVCTPILWPALIIGGYILLNRSKSRIDEFQLMAGLLTLKPIPATAIWEMLILGINTLEPPIRFMRYFLTIAPGAILTLIFLIIFRSLLTGSRANMTCILFLLDCLRWGSTFLMMMGLAGYTGLSSRSALTLILVVLSFSMPTIFAIVALIFVRQNENSIDKDY